MKKYLQKFKNLEPLTIVAVGDSTTSQEWTHPNWVDWLEFSFKQKPQWPKGLVRRIFNSGIDGAEIDTFIDNFDYHIGMFKPDAVIVSLGFNNIELAGKVDMEAKLRELFGQIKSIDADLITWSTYETPNPQYSQQLNQISQQYQKLTQEFDGVFVDIYSEFQKYDLDQLFTYTCLDGNSEWNIAPGERDFLHCNALGNQIIAEKIIKEAFEDELLDWEDMGNMRLEELGRIG